MNDAPWDLVRERKAAFELLGLAEGVSPKDIREAYLVLAKINHPDKHVGDVSAEDGMTKINLAYRILCVPESLAEKHIKKFYGDGGSIWV